jgi:TolA-binding protein
MDPLLMVGAWAAAVISIVAAANVMYRAFLKAVKLAVTDEFDRVWKELDEQDKWQHARFEQLSAQITDLCRKVERLMGERV